MDSLHNLTKQLQSNDAQQCAEAAEAIGNATIDTTFPIEELRTAFLAAIDQHQHEARAMLHVVWAVGQHDVLQHHLALRERIEALQRDEGKKRSPDVILLSEIRRLPPLDPAKSGDRIPTSSRDTIFISYAREDAAWLQYVNDALAPLVRARPEIRTFSDRDIKPGAHWRQEIDTALSRSRTGLLLVSHQFLASKFIMETELPVLLSLHEQKKLTIVAVAISASGIEHTPLKDIQFVNDPAQPLDGLTASKRKKALKDIVSEIQAAFDRR